MNMSNNCVVLNTSSGGLLAGNITVVASNSVGLVSSLSAIALILAARAYKDLIQRLILYLSLSALVSSLATLIGQVVQWSKVMNKPWEEALLRTLMGYAILAYYILICWMALYVFMFALFQVRLNSIKYEVTGLVIGSVLPFTVLWTIPAYEHLGCLLVYKTLIVQCYGLFLPVSLCSLLAFVTIAAVVFKMCRAAVNVNNRRRLSGEPLDLRGRLIRRAVVELVTLFAFILVQNTSSFALFAAYGGMFLEVNESKQKPLFTLTMFAHFFPITFVAIPVLLLCQSRVRRGVRSAARCKRTKCYSSLSAAATSPRQGSADEDAAAMISSEEDGSFHQTTSVQRSSGSFETCTERDPLMGTRNY